MFRYTVNIIKSVVEKYMLESASRRKYRVKLDPDSLRWTPPVFTQMLHDEEEQAERGVGFNTLVCYFFMPGSQGFFISFFCWYYQPCICVHFVDLTS